MNPAVYDTTPFNPADVYTERDEPVTHAVAPIQTAYPSALASYSDDEDLLSGVELMDEDWRERPMISLKDGMFEDGEGYNYGKSFEGLFDKNSKERARKKYAWQVPKGSAKTELAYVYELAGKFPIKDKQGNIIGEREVTDEMIPTNKKRKDGTFITLAEFKASLAGKDVILKTYYEVDILLHMPGTEKHGKKRRVSVSPTSASACSGHISHMNQIRVLGTHPIRFIVGDKFKPNDNPAYYPWKFEIVV